MTLSSLLAHGCKALLVLDLLSVAILTGCAGASGTGTGTTTTPTPAPTPAAVAPAITTQPSAQTVYAGDTAAFSVVASGTAPLAYEWRRNGTAVSSGASANYTTPATALTDDGSSYTVLVSNAAGSIVSSVAKLSVMSRTPQITVQPLSTTVASGNNAAFSVTATGPGPLSYQWLRGGGAIAGATAATYTVAPARLSDNGSTYSVVVTNSSGSVTSSAATLTVTPAPPAIVTQPAGITLFSGETGSFSVSALGGDALTYQWRRNAAAIAGATSATYSLPAVSSADDNAVFDVVLSNAAGTVTSSPATLHVGPFATDYKSQRGDVLHLYAWPAVHTAILTSSASLSPSVMRSYLTASDGIYNYYAGAVGKAPSLFVNYNGVPTIAEVPSSTATSCGGAACTYIGATGMEIADPYFAWMLDAIPFKAYDQVPFYEWGRSFWVFPQLSFSSPYSNSCLNTGFAVLMRFRSMTALGYQGSFNSFASGPTDAGAAAAGISNYNTLLANNGGLIDTYAADTSLTFQNTFLTDSFKNPNGGCADLFASMIQRLARDNGGEAFIQALWKEVLKRPTATMTQDAADNFILAASAAANKNLTSVFQNQWRWPISISASNEATSRFGPP